MKYFEVESKIVELKNIANQEERRTKFFELISFLGADPVGKMDEAFKAQYQVSVLKYLDI
jgi:transcription antitermination factor NusA-like protein